MNGTSCGGFNLNVNGTGKLGGNLTVGGGLQLPFASASASFSLAAGQSNVELTGTTASQTATIPHALPASGQAQTWFLWNDSTQTWTVACDSGNVLGGGSSSASVPLAANTWIAVSADGTNCWQLAGGGSASFATTPNGVPQYLIEVPSGGALTAPAGALAGVPIDATNPATLLVTDRASYLNWSSGTALALPAVTASFASNFPFAIKNTASSTLTITPNAGESDTIDGSATGMIIPEFAAFVYQTGTTAPFSWETIKFPTFAAFGSTCAVALQWSPTTGFSCATENGTGNLVGTTNASLVTPNLGTPSALVLTNATSLPCGALPALTGDTTSSAGSCATTNVALRGLTLPTLAASTGLLYDAAGTLSLPSTLPTAAEPAHTGDVTNTAGSLGLTLATVNSNVGSFTNANVTVDAKGRITAVTNGSLASQANATWLINDSGSSAPPSAIAAPTSANLIGTGTNGQPVSEETDLGTITYNASGTTTFAAASAFIAAGIVTATHSTSTTFSPTGLIKWGSYTVEIKQDSTGGGVTFTLGTGGTCSAWKLGGGGSGAITLSTAANAIDILAFTYDGANCVANFRANFN